MTADHFFLLWVAMMTTMVTVAIVIRRRQGLTFFQPRFSDAELIQNWRSAASTRGLLGKLARANNCAWIVLTRDTLRTGLHFPFNIFMPKFLSDVELTIPISAISSVTTESSLFLGECVRITYALSGNHRDIGRTEEVDLYPRRDGRLRDLLDQKLARSRPSR